MEKIVYADSLFLMNFCVDYLALVIGGRLCGVKIHGWLCVLSCVVGGIYSVATAYFSVGGILLLLLNILVSFIMCFIAYDIKSVFSLLLTVVSFFTANVVFGGFISAIYAFFGRNDAFSLPFGAIILVLGVVFLLAEAIFRTLKEARTVGEVDCSITMLGKTKRVRLMCDSGNLLRDPFYSRRVIVLSSGVFPEISGALLCGELDRLSRARPRIIPAVSALGDSILYGFTPDSVVLHRERADTSLEATIAFCAREQDTFGGTDGIFPSALL